VRSDRPSPSASRCGSWRRALTWDGRVGSASTAFKATRQPVARQSTTAELALRDRAQRCRQDDDDGTSITGRNAPPTPGKIYFRPGGPISRALTEPEGFAATPAIGRKFPEADHLRAAHRVREPRSWRWKAEQAGGARPCLPQALRPASRERIAEKHGAGSVPGPRGGPHSAGALSHGPEAMARDRHAGLVQDPKVLLLDEPVAGNERRGDRAHRGAVRCRSPGRHSLVVVRARPWRSSETIRGRKGHRCFTKGLGARRKGPMEQVKNESARDRGFTLGSFKGLNQYYGGRPPSCAT